MNDDNKEQVQQTQHAFLEAWGQFAHEIGPDPGYPDGETEAKTLSPCAADQGTGICWVSVWLVEQAQPGENILDIRKMGIKRLVQLAAHVSPRVIRNSVGMLLMFSEHSAFAGKLPKLPSSGFPPHKKHKF